jgi:hypothetical protein
LLNVAAADEFPDVLDGREAMAEVSNRTGASDGAADSTSQ